MPRSHSAPTLTHHLARVLLVLAASALPLFWLLGSLPAQQWDEARTGLNALEILRSNNWLVLTHRGEPDLWNGKPPLAPWLMALSFKLLGPTEVALRLPSALAALATVLVVYFAGSRWLGSWRAGLLAALVLLTTQGYVTLHVSRTGDFDALLTLWTTLGTLSWLAYLATGRPRHAWGTGAAFALAVLTKGIAGLLFGPGIILATLLTGQLSRLRKFAPWGAFLLILGVGITWYTVRELAAPGYLAGVWQYEVGGPAGEALEGHSHPFYWYLSKLAETKFQAWLVVALIGMGMGWWMPRHSRGWWLSRVLGTVAVVFLLVISTVKTQLLWYDAPVYPLLALLAAGGLVWTGRAVAAHYRRSPSPTARLAAVLLVASLPYGVQLLLIRHSTDMALRNSSLLYGRHLRAQAKQLPHLHEYILGDDGIFNDSPEFYMAAITAQYGHRITRVGAWQVGWAIPPRVVVTCGAKARATWQQYYQTRVLFSTDSCVTFRLEARR
ncbi:glycosyltransferase family 39 protein [Hymenobacter sp. BT188]|uniref:ArnT family glycosyltransferase n=1 Tax=Hymenobacter sp. BT188 TaxID=2763504 RepID=UPI00165166BA|nr:glycosyltransferase family 39 protein [Hymenobacter sp. BT188]MBC6606034.1 glycosyltransferase family 39 protein [Hymenobacter sp. BT188]